MFDETTDQAWKLRYGVPAPANAPDLGKLLNHRSVRSYSQEPVSEDIIAGLVAAAQSAASSSNLQLYSIVSVQDPERREAIALSCDPNPQVRTAPWFLVFCADHYRMRKAAQDAGEEANGLDFMEYYTMAVVDAALAAERMVCGAESLGLGICYIGALRNHPDKIKEILNLPEGVFGLFGLTIGWPAQPLQAEIKPRLDQDAIWFRETYDANASVEGYNQRMIDFYVSQKMKGDYNWAKRSGRRVDDKHLTGRETQKEWIESQGFGKR